MTLNVMVMVKQVIDPDIQISGLNLDQETLTVSASSTSPSVVNGYDEQAVEAALRLKDLQDTHITAISIGAKFAMDVIKKPLSMGCDELVLLQDPLFENLDSFGVAQLLATAISNLGHFDLILGGRQASDWDNAQVPSGVSEILSIPCITMAKDVKVFQSKVIVERVIPDGSETVETDLPSVVIVSNELGKPRFPTITNIMAAARKTPKIVTAQDLDFRSYEPQVKITDLYIPVIDKDCEFIESEDEGDLGRKLALTLREAKLI